MSDLTRRVLDADARLTREDGTISSAQWDDAVMELLDAAPILARQIEAVEALADELDREASEHMDRPVHSRSGTRIRTALNSVD